MDGFYPFLTMSTKSSPIPPRVSCTLKCCLKALLKRQTITFTTRRKLTNRLPAENMPLSIAWEITLCCTIQSRQHGLIYVLLCSALTPFYTSLRQHLFVTLTTQASTCLSVNQIEYQWQLFETQNSRMNLISETTCM